jgi:hypothetical protein
MGRTVTAGIKNRRKVTIYPSHLVCDAYIHQHIDLQGKLGRYIDKTHHCDAVLSVGMQHIEEVIKEIERLGGSTPGSRSQIINQSDKLPVSPATGKSRIDK